MSFINAQQAKLDLELVPKEKRLEIVKCNGRLNPEKIQREPTFQVVWMLLLSLHATLHFSSLQMFQKHNGEINSLNDVVVDHMHQPWRTFAALINKGLSGKTTGLDKLRLSRAQILWVSWRNKIRMHTSIDDYLINTLRFVSAKEATQFYGKLLPESLTRPEMKETKVYKTYLGFATGATPPKISRKFKKASPSKKDINLNLVSMEEEPKSAKKKGMDKDDNNNDHDSSSDGSDQENNSDDDNTQSDSEKGSDSRQETDENESDDTNAESKIDDYTEGDEDKGIDDTTKLLYDDVDVRLNEPVPTDEGLVQKEGVDAEMINV
nr:hypothetical protein [Tanacetum cinerariifolium]